MSEKEEKKTSSAKLSTFVEKNKFILITVCAAIVVALIVFIVVDVVKTNATSKNLTRIDEISYTLTNGSVTAEESELETRKTVALENLAPFTNKGGIVGVRANMLSAEIAYQNEDYESALNFWKATEAKGKKSYTAPVAKYNAAVCYEELGNLEEAANLYKAAADEESFLLRTHAKFSYGRVLETQGKYAEAVAAYKDLNDTNPDDNWAMIAKSRILTLQNEGKAE